MNAFLLSLFIIVVFTVCVSMATHLEKREENKKEEFLVSDKILSEDEKQKIRAEEYIDLYTKLKYMDKIYITDQGTILNSKPHTFKDFINNQKLPSKLELTWEILADNNIKISDIIKLIESGAPYPMDTKVGLSIDYLKVTSQQMRMIEILNMYDELIKIDDNYPLYIKFIVTRNYYDEKITVMYQAGYDDKHPYRGYLTTPTRD